MRSTLPDRTPQHWQAGSNANEDPTPVTADTTPSRKEIYDFLSQIPRLAAWPAAEVEKLSNDVEVLNIPAGGYVFETSYQADDAYLVYAGQVRQAVASAQGAEWWHRTLRDGEFFTQQALFRGASYASTAKAELDSVLLRVSAAILSDLLTKHPDLWVIFYTNTAARLQAIPLLRSLDDDQIERLSVTAEEKPFEAGETICSADQAESWLYLIDWGQVSITQQVQTELSGGQPIATAPTPEVVRQQGFSVLPHLLTAGNYFVGGLMRIPHQLSVSAVAVTKAKVIRIAATYVEQLEDRFPDVQYVLRNRPSIASRLKQALQNEPLFADLTDDHWAALATITGWEHVPSNLDVTRQGQVGSKLYVLAAGAALVRATDDDARERPRHYSRIGMRDYYGINALLRGDRHDATVRSMVEPGPLGEPLDGTDWYTLQHDDVLYLTQSNSDLWLDTLLWRELSEKPKEKKRYSWQEPDEEIVLFERKHWLWLCMRLAGVFAAVFAVYALLVAVDSLLDIITLQAFTYALVALLLLALPISWFVIDYLNDYYVITSKRVLRHERVFLVYEDQQTAPLERIQDVTSQASIFGKLFNYARLTVTTAGMGVIVFDMLPHPETVEERVRKLQGKARAGELGAQRENLRNKMLSRLKIRLTPSIPDRVLPEGMTTPPQLTDWQRFWRRISNPWRRFWRWLRSRPEAIYLTLIRILPKHTQEKLLRERAIKKSKEIKPMEDDIVYRKHPWFLLKAAAIPLAVIGVTAALVILDVVSVREFRQDFRALGTAYSIFLLICLLWLWFRVENWRNDKYILTKTHITYIYKIPLGLYERRRQAEWDKVQNANYVIPGLWANLINFGTVVVETASVEGKFEFENIGNPRKVQQEVMLRLGLTRAAQAQRTRDQQQSALSETLEIYNELIQDWATRNQWVGAPPPPGAQTTGNGQPPR